MTENSPAANSAAPANEPIRTARHPTYTPPPQYQPEGSWVFHPSGPTSPNNGVSGLRVSAGVIAIFLGAWGTLCALAGLFSPYFYDGAMSAVLCALLAAATIAIFVTGIVVLAKSRQRRDRTPVVLLVISGTIALLALVSSLFFFSIPASPFMFLVALAVLIVMGLGLAKEQKSVRD